MPRNQKQWNGRGLRSQVKCLLGAGAMGMWGGIASCNDDPAPSAGTGGSSPSTTDSDAAGGGAGEAGAQGEPTSPTAVGDDFVEAVSVEVHPEVNTVLEVRWQQVVAADAVWLEFSTGDTGLLASRASPGTLGAKRDVVLGVPGEAEVTVNIVSRVGTTEHRSREYRGRTLAVPEGMPRPEVLGFAPDLASPERWLFGSVEDSFGGGGGNYYYRTFWLYIMDRQGRIVWYYADPASNASSSFQRRALDGEYLVFEKRCYGCGVYDESIVRMTLDYGYFEEVAVQGLSDCIDVTPEGTILYDAYDTLRELNDDGSYRVIWSCRDHFGVDFDCYTNTVNYHAATNSILLAFPEPGMLVEIERDSGELLGQYGSLEGSWQFAPPLTEPPTAWSFGYPHFPNYTPSGTLLVSAHMPGYEDTAQPVKNQHAFVEFEVDRVGQVLSERWRYTDGPEWPRHKGMAIRLANGNTLANYGTNGVIREITPDKATAWYVKFDVPEGDDFYNKMVGHNELIDDLYALNGGRFE